MNTINNAEELVHHLLHHKYTSVGSYPTYFITARQDVLSFNYVKENAADQAEAIMLEEENRIVAIDINYEGDLYCNGTGEKIEKAYP